jgi:hypothetical protein
VHGPRQLRHPRGVPAFCRNHETRWLSFLQYFSKETFCPTNIGYQKCHPMVLLLSDNVCKVKGYCETARLALDKVTDLKYVP